MATVMLEGLLPDHQGPVVEIGDESFVYGLLFMIFIVVGSITVMNMLTGMLVQVVQGIADVEKEELHLSWVKMELERVMTAMDVNKDVMLSKEEVENVLCNPEACKVINEVGVDVVQLVEVAEFHIFKERDDISFAEFLDLVLQLRHSKAVCLRDIVYLQQFVSNELLMTEDRIVTAF